MFYSLFIICCTFRAAVSAESFGAGKIPNMETDGISTKTSIEQTDCEKSCLLFYVPLSSLKKYEIETLESSGLLDESQQVCLLRKAHKNYLLRGLEYLPPSFQSLDASRPWSCYWILHSLELLNELPSNLFSRTIDTLTRCKSPCGGYGGGPQQLGHVAPTYAAILTLVTIGTKAAFEAIDRKSLIRFFLSLKQSNGAFSAHAKGEVDIRVTYCVIAIASLLDLLSEELISGVVEYALSCQTFEGGFGGEPFNEAHGGYAYCAVAVLAILKSLHLANIPLLMHWISSRQMPLEGGYQGRTNKLVDGCYSYWQGAIPVILSTYLRKNQSDKEYSISQYLCTDQLKLQQYILLCAQQIEGGLRDKPGKPRDHYHTCYCLSGLSLAQYADNATEPIIYGNKENLLVPIHPLYNISLRKFNDIQVYLSSL